jgi:hypothetical protein
MASLILAIILAGQPPIIVVLPNGQTVRADAVDYRPGTLTLKVTANGIFNDGFDG